MGKFDGQVPEIVFEPLGPFGPQDGIVPSPEDVRRHVDELRRLARDCAPTLTGVRAVTGTSPKEKR